MPSSTALIASHSALEDLLTELQGESAIGIDTEFLRERTYRAELCLVQMTTRQEPVCIDPITLGDLEPLRSTSIRAARSRYCIRDDKTSRC
jgi:ribonuclease D